MGEAAARVVETGGGGAPDPRPKVISRVTLTSAALMAVAAVGIAVVDYLRLSGMSGPIATGVIIVMNLVPLAVGIHMLPIALSFGKGGSIRLQWTLFTLAMLSVGVGGVIWLVLYSMIGRDPFPSLADVFYAPLYLLIMAGLLLAILGYRGIADFRLPVAVGALVGAGGAVLEYVVVLRPFVLSASAGSMSLMARVLSVAYPLADCFLIIMPAVILGLVVTRLGSGRIAWPWWVLVVASLILAVADSAYSYVKFAGVTNTLLPDVGWIVAALLTGLAALVARDVYKS
jgi:hypothetical protein